MESRIYTVDRTACGEEHLNCFKGFNRKCMDAPYVAVLCSEGEWEVWALDDLGPAKDEFIRFLKIERDYYATHVVAYYKNDSGDHCSEFNAK